MSAQNYRANARYNQAGMLAPYYSPWGQIYEGGVGETFDDSPPIGSQASGVRQSAFGGFIGAFFSRTAHVIGLPHPMGYGGDSPQGLQASVDVLPPWQRPRGV